MKIVFLGTGHGVPSAERACSAAMIEVGGAIYYVDAGCAMVERTLAAGRQIGNIRAVFNTHCHTDHILGAVHLADLFNWYYKDFGIDLYLPEQSVIDGIKGLIAATTRPIDGERIRFHKAAAGEIYRDENVTVSLYPTKHIASVGRPSYGVLIEGEGKRVYFSGDMSQWLGENDFPTEIAGSGLDLFVVEFAHFRSEHLFPHLAGVNARAVAFNHVYPLDKYGELEGIRGKYPFEVLTPDDMTEIEI